jgi:glycosyltransferase involved in cell wall biosynthesis
MIKLSVVVITFNEEQNIERCLKSVEDIADEIVVVDSFSKDKTESICNKYNVRFIQNKFDGHIQQKNFAVEQATYDYVLSLDADEELSKELKSSILQVKSSFNADGYYFNRLNNYCGQWIKHSGWYPDKKLRLWDRRKGKWGGENPHDRYEMVQGADIKHIKGDLLHYTYYSVSQHIAQMNKFTDIGALSAFNKGRRISLLQIIVSPLWRFVRDYFIKLGILDGFYGFVVCIVTAHFTFIKYVKIRELNTL